MTENAEQPSGAPYIRLSKEEFLTQLDTAATWMIWINPIDQEVEMVVHDETNDEFSVFRGPHPVDMNQIEYAAFAAEIEKLSEVKDASDGGSP